ncbi:MAG: DUF3108 domain-containing protein [Massilia sp.]
MKHRSLIQFLLAAAFTAASVSASAAPDLASAAGIKRPVDLPPSADLSYAIKARQKGFQLAGDATVNWRLGGGKYSVHSDTRAALFGSLIDDRSEGTVDSFGLAPVQFTEKRVRHEPWSANFDRSKNQISFTESKVTYPIKGGEQDRTSVLFQLAGVARAAPDKMTPGSEWTFFVAGRRDADAWTFKVVKPENVQTGFGSVDALHLVRVAQPDSKDQTLDVWLAPGKEWYPVRIKFTDDDDEFVDQTLQTVTRK